MWQMWGAANRLSLPNTRRDRLLPLLLTKLDKILCSFYDEPRTLTERIRIYLREATMELIERVEIRKYIPILPGDRHYRKRKGAFNYEYGYGYKMVFHDCLPGKEWLEAHYQDFIPEPTIEILVDGATIANLNSNYKRGMIKQILQPYTKKGGKNNARA